MTLYELKLICTEQLEVFLSKDTSEFIENMFSALDSRSYMNSSPKNSIENISKQTPVEESPSSIVDKNISTEKSDSSDEKILEETANSSKKESPPRRPLKYSNKKCFEFQAKGHCSRGNNCPYQHIHKTNETAERVVKLGVLPLIPTGEIIKNIMQNEVFNQMYAQNKLAYGLAHQSNGEINHHKRKYNNPNLYTFNKSSSQVSKTLVLRKIDANSVDINDINNYFSKFGKIVNVIMSFENEPSSVLLEYSNQEEARSAFECPDAIFGNRFIKIFYYKPNPKNDDQPQAKIPASNDLIYVNPDFLAKEQEAKKEISIKKAEFEGKKQKFLVQIEEETKKLLIILRNPDLGEDQKEEYRACLKELMADKDRLLYHQSDSNKSKSYKFNSQRPNQLDKRPTVLLVQLNKFSNPNDILSHFSKYGKISFSKKDKEVELIIGFTNHFSASK
ncbi:hypothetical protein HZS_6734, partial [Henneguya salminicola]